jgi:hypothetical protein
LEALDAATIQASSAIAGTSFGLAAFHGTSYPAGEASHHFMRIMGYSQTSLHKTIQAAIRQSGPTTGAFNAYTSHRNGNYRDTNAITQIDLLTIPGSGQLMLGSYAVLRGIP